MPPIRPAVLRQREYMKNYMQQYRKSHPVYLAQNREQVKQIYEQARADETPLKAMRRRAKHRKLISNLRENFVFVQIDGKGRHVKVDDKRQRPDSCELCGKNTKLAYHHWNDDILVFGMWLCYGCHMRAEKIEHGWMERYEDYLILRDNLDMTFGIDMSMMEVV